MKTNTKILSSLLAIGFMGTSLVSANNRGISIKYDSIMPNHIRNMVINDYRYEFWDSNGKSSMVATITDHNNDGILDESKYFSPGSSIV